LGNQLIRPTVANRRRRVRSASDRVYEPTMTREVERTAAAIPPMSESLYDPLE
jgi:hypothetical protein